MDVERAGEGRPPLHLDCPWCSGAMRVAREHLGVQVACPHCGQVIEPRRHTVADHQAAFGAACRGPDGTAGTIAYSSRDRVAAGLLGVLLGPIGAHRFYLGYTGIGTAQILLTICTFGFAGFWGFIEGVLILCDRPWPDADGLPLRRYGSHLVGPVAYVECGPPDGRCY